jgi:threonine synthase
MVSDAEIIEAYKLIASCEGILAEPASAASVAGLIKSSKAGLIEEGSTIACVLTGNGLKDPDSAIKYSTTEVIKTSSKIDDIAKAIKF